jgi:hypothetical protein
MWPMRDTPRGLSGENHAPHSPAAIVLLQTVEHALKPKSWVPPDETPR